MLTGGRPLEIQAASSISIMLVKRPAAVTSAPPAAAAPSSGATPAESRPSDDNEAGKVLLPPELFSECPSTAWLLNAFQCFSLSWGNAWRGPLAE